MIPKELAKALDGLEFEYDGGVLLKSVDWSEETLLLAISIRTGQDDQPDQLWTVRCNGVRKESFCFEWADTLVEEAEHPLLWPYIKDGGSLFFGALNPDRAKLIGDMFAAHFSITGNYFPFGRFINENWLSASKPWGSSGLFAEGPLVILEAFRAVLEKYGATCRITNVCLPKRWTGSEFVPESKDLHILLIGDSFVIAEHFEYERTQQ